MKFGSAAKVILCLATSAIPLSKADAQPAPAVAAAPIVQWDYDTLFQQMYKTPSNLDVSFKFAEQAVARGDYEAAIGALERMLFFNSNLPRVKFELGVLYFKLGSYELARGYLQDALNAPDTPDDVRGQVRAYLTEIDRRLSRFEYSGFLQAGVRYQTNANIGPDSLAVRALGQDAILDNRFGRRPDWNSFEIAAVNLAYKVNMRGDAIEATLLGLDSRQFKLSQFNLGVVEGLVGHRVAIGQDASFKFYGIADQVWLGDANYFSALGVGLSARTTIGNVGLAEAFVERRQRNFSDSVNYPTASQQSGGLVTSAVATDFRVLPWLHWTTRVGYDDNHADFNYNSYKRYSIDIAFPIEFAIPFFGVPHQFVIAPTVGYSTADYAAPNAIIDPNTNRHDKELRYGAIFDAQLYNNIGLRTQVQYSKIDSSLPNYTTSNFSSRIWPKPAVLRKQPMTLMTKSLVTFATALLATCAFSLQGSAEQVGAASAVNPAATINMRTLTIGTSIAHMERIRTQASGSVQVLFIDKTSMTIGPNSDVTIDNYVFDPKSGTGSLAATVGKGALRFVGGLISHNGQAEIKTATSTIGIRGGVALIKGPDIYIGYGSTTVSSGGATGTPGAGEYTQTLGGGAPPTPPGPPPIGFVASLIQLFQSTPGQTGGVAAGSASQAKVAAAEKRATGSAGGSVAGALTPPLVLTAPPVTQLASSVSSINQAIQTSAQTTAATQSVGETVKEPERPTVTLQGYSGGIDRVTHSNTQYSAVYGTSTIALDATANKVQANFTAFGSTVDTFQFGSTDPADTTSSTYTNYDNFSAKSKVGGTFNNVGYSGEMTTVSREAARQTAISLGNTNPTICQCDYTRWGLWSVQNPTNTESILSTWVAGRPALVSDVPLTGTATYVGHVMGYASSGQAAARQVSGNFSNSVNFGARTGAVSVTNLDSTNYSGTVTLQTDPRNFAGTLAGNVGNRSMALGGSFYRAPTNPVGEMGGSVVMSGTNYTGCGIFAAAVKR